MPNQRPVHSIQTGTVSGHFDAGCVVMVFLKTEQGWITPVFFDPPRFHRLLGEQRCTPMALVGRRASFDGLTLRFGEGPPAATPQADRLWDPAKPPRFLLGWRYATAAAARAMAEAGQDPLELFRRHQYGDWGDLDADDRAANEIAVRDEYRILSAYRLATGVTVWVITEEDRSATTILLPDEN